MRILFALCFFCLSSLVSAHPITYVFTGTLDRFEFWRYKDGIYTAIPSDPSIPLSIDGVKIFNGRTEVIGSITVDHELGTVYGSTPPGVYFGQVVSWQMAFGGVAFNNAYSLSQSSQWVGYAKGQFGLSDEVTETSIPASPDVVVMVFDFKGAAFSNSKPNELPVQSFNGGSFRMTGFAGQVSGNLFGSITSLHRVDSVEDCGDLKTKSHSPDEKHSDNESERSSSRGTSRGH